MLWQTIFQLVRLLDGAQTEIFFRTLTKAFDTRGSSGPRSHDTANANAIAIDIAVRQRNPSIIWPKEPNSQKRASSAAA